MATSILSSIFYHFSHIQDWSLSQLTLGEGSVHPTQGRHRETNNDTFTFTFTFTPVSNLKWKGKTVVFGGNPHKHRAM